MNIEVYCDESRQQYFARAGESVDGFALIGSLWIEAERRQEYNDRIKELRAQHGYWHEFKWNKVSPVNLHFYLDLIRLFFGEDMRFRCIVLPVGDLNAVEFHDADCELMFYKFYYQVLHHWILDGNQYRVYVDLKTNRVHNRLRVLKEYLRQANRLAAIQDIQALPSHQVNLIQLVDVLVGATGYKVHRERNSTTKLAVLSEIEHGLGHPIAPTARDVKKFNIFRFKPGGGW